LISIEDINMNEEEESPHNPVITNENFDPRVFLRVLLILSDLILGILPL